MYKENLEQTRIEEFICEVSTGLPITNKCVFIYPTNNYRVKTYKNEIRIYCGRKLFLKMKIMHNVIEVKRNREIGDLIIFNRDIDLIDDIWLKKHIYSFWRGYCWAISPALMHSTLNKEVNDND